MPITLPQYLEDLVNELPGDKNAWRYFFAVTQIPRGSNQEGEFFRHKKILAFLKQAAEELGHETYVDTGDNLIIRKKAYPGLEDKPTVCLQCHMDMVVQKNDDCPIDLENDPLQPYSDGTYIRAKGTSLGADNGIGIGSCFAILADKELHHGPLEVLVTRDEETGLYGAAALEPNILKAKYLINVDNEDRDKICIGCAGGYTFRVQMELQREFLDGYIIKKIVLNHCKGGHSGDEIHLGRCNPVHIISRILKASSIDYRIISIDCGTAHNAIPRKCEVFIAYPKVNENQFIQDITLEFNKFAHEYKKIESEVTFDVFNEQIDLLPTTKTSTQQLINFLNIFPFGPMRMSPDVEGLVETSITLAITKTSEHSFDFTGSVRSSSDSQIEMMYRKVQSICELCNCKLSEKIGQYPGWEPKPEGFVTQTLRKAYIDCRGVDPEIYACHAGLECGLLHEKYPDVDCTSVGPEVKHPHSPAETLLIISVEEFMRVLKRALELLIE